MIRQLALDLHPIEENEIRKMGMSDRWETSSARASQGRPKAKSLLNRE